MAVTGIPQSIAHNVYLGVPLLASITFSTLPRNHLFQVILYAATMSPIRQDTFLSCRCFVAYSWIFASSLFNSSRSDNFASAYLYQKWCGLEKCVMCTKCLPHLSKFELDHELILCVRMPIASVRPCHEHADDRQSNTKQWTHSKLTYATWLLEPTSRRF